MGGASVAVPAIPSAISSQSSIGQNNTNSTTSNSVGDQQLQDPQTDEEDLEDMSIKNRDQTHREQRKPDSLGKFKGNDAKGRENDMPGDIVKEEGLTNKQGKILHDVIGKESISEGRALSRKEIREVAQRIKRGELH